MSHATFTRPGLTTFTRLDELGLEGRWATLGGQACSPVLACRVVEPDQWCRRCGCQRLPRDSLTRRLAHEPFGWRPTTLVVTVRRSLPRHRMWARVAPGHQQGRRASREAVASGVAVGVGRTRPRWERHDLAHDEWWNAREPLLYGQERVHDLRDVYRDHLGNHPGLAAQVRAQYPDGPLAITHTRRGIPCRYDAIYASPEFTVVDVEHQSDEARAAGSDHALVRATLDWDT